MEKLNEGWDVLNLFDIVRCYEKRDSGKNKIGKTTMREAQLIGRGARYFPFIIKDMEKTIPNFPFTLDNSDDPYKRKFDQNLEHELRVLEELNYHSINDSKYISEIRTALIETGIMEEKQTIKPLKLKEDFKQTDFYNKGLIYINEKVKNRYKSVKSLSDMGVSLKNYVHKTGTGKGTVTKAFLDRQVGGDTVDARRVGGDTVDADPIDNRDIEPSFARDTQLKDMPFHIVQNAVAKDDFFNFKNLKKYFPSLQSIREFIKAENFSSLAITFQGHQPSDKDFLDGILGLLEKIKNEMQKNITEHKGTKKFYSHFVKDIFKDKAIKVSGKKTDDNVLFVSKRNGMFLELFMEHLKKKPLFKCLKAKWTN